MIKVPKEIFDALVSGKVAESEDNPGNEPFSFNDFIDKVDHESKIVDYLKTKNFSYLGEGSSRIAFMIPSGGCIDVPDRTICFKCAKNLAGIGQNRAEHKIFTKYGKEEKCFPTVYKYDTKRNICLETEIGTDVENFNLEDYFENWNKEVMKRRSFIDWLKRKPKMIGHMLEINSIDDLYDVLWRLRDWKSFGEKFKSLIDSYLACADEIVKKHKEYEGIASLFRVMFEKGASAELVLGDLHAPVNYAMIDRGYDKPVLIPIDYGFTNEVFDSFYDKNDKNHAAYFAPLAKGLSTQVGFHDNENEANF